jgi:hypothetical protein
MGLVLIYTIQNPPDCVPFNVYICQLLVPVKEGKPVTPQYVSM